MAASSARMPISEIPGGSCPPVAALIDLSCVIHSCESTVDVMSDLFSERGEDRKESTGVSASQSDVKFTASS